MAEGAEALVEFGHCGAELSGFAGETSAFGHGSGAEFGELGVLDSESGGLLFAAELFCSRGGELLVELLDALVLAVVDAVRLFEVGGSVAAALFKSGESGGCCGRCLLELFATAAEQIELLLKRRRDWFPGWYARSRTRWLPADGGR